MTTCADATVASPAVSTRSLLLAGAAAAPLFTVAVLAQAALRSGYDLTRHPASVLANGDLGWVQVIVFLLTGALTLLAAVGVRRRLGGVAAPVLLTVQGLGLIVAGIFKLDPLDGFPAGTPLGQPDAMSSEAMVHNAAGSLSFLALIVACFVLARRFGRDGQRGWAAAGRAAAVVFIAGLVWAMSGGAAGSLTLFVGVVVAWTWMAASAVRLSR
jgi:hypothetical membrane protein